MLVSIIKLHFLEQLLIFFLSNFLLFPFQNCWINEFEKWQATIFLYLLLIFLLIHWKSSHLSVTLFIQIYLTHMQISRIRLPLERPSLAFWEVASICCFYLNSCLSFLPINHNLLICFKSLPDEKKQQIIIIIITTLIYFQ